MAVGFSGREPHCGDDINVFLNRIYSTPHFLGNSCHLIDVGLIRPLKIDMEILKTVTVDVVIS